MNIEKERHEVDRLIGLVLKEKRLKAGLCLKDVASHCGVSLQQIQKYEHGSNRISVSRLFEVANSIGVKPAELLAEVERRVDQAAAEAPTTHRNGSRKTVETFESIEDPAARSALLQLAAAIGRSPRTD